MRGEPVITVRVNWLMGEEHLDPPWTLRRSRALRGGDRRRAAAAGHLPRPAPADVDADAALERNPGIIATAMHCVNAIPYVCDAEPGIRTYLDLPLVCGRADPSLRRAARPA